MRKQTTVPGAAGAIVTADEEKEIGLLGSKSIVRTNPKSDRFPVKRFHHVEFWCADAVNTACRFSYGLGMPLAAKSDLSTGNLVHASYLIRSGDLCIVFSAPYSPSISNGGSGKFSSAIPTFDCASCRDFSFKHGLAVRAVAVEVEDAESAFNVSLSNGAKPSAPPVVLGDGRGLLSEVQLYGDVVLRYVSFKKNSSSISIRESPNSERDYISSEKNSNSTSIRQNSSSIPDCTRFKKNSIGVKPNSEPDHWFLPGFAAISESSSFSLDFGLRRLDHAVGNVPELRPAVEYVKRFTGFHEFAEFTAEEVGTTESGLNSVALANNDEMVLLPLNEPVFGTKRKSQIQTYLEHNEGSGLQHLALVTEDIFRTLREMRKRSGAGGFEFMPAPPPTYYQNLKRRAGDALNDIQIKECKELGILVDRDEQGTLLQIFTKPVGDRPTIFIEIIQRIGCMMKDDAGKMYQKGGCGGFGKGNFTELFKSVEEYEKILESKWIAESTIA